MLIKTIDCSQYTLNDRINEFEKDNKIINITYLFKDPSNIISIIKYTEKKEYKKKIAKQEKQEKLEQQKEEADIFIL